MASAKPVIIVGSGLAGLSAAHEALRAGARVHLLERAAKPGGNSIKASSGINGAGTRFQKAAGVEVDDKFYDDTVRSAGQRFRQAQAQAAAKEKGDAEGNANAINRTALIDALVSRSESAVHWLTDEIGVDLSVVAPLGGHSLPRTHRGAGQTPPGMAIVSTLLKQLSANPNFQLSTSATVESLAVDEAAKAVVGLTYNVAVAGNDGTATTTTTTQHELEGPVVFAAGGFAGDANGLLAKHRPDLAGIPSTNDPRPASHGLLERAGAQFVDMDSVQVHPTGFVDPKDPYATYKFLAAEVLRGEGGILLAGGEDEEGGGRRFVNEMETREVVSKAIMETLSPSNNNNGVTATTTRQWDVTLLLDPGACEATAGHLGFYLFKGLMEKKKVKDLRPREIEAVDRYAAAVASGTDADFGRRNFGRWRLPPGEANREEEVCVGKVTPITHFTMGGAAFNERAQVLGRGLAPIKGLWAAGEVTGGIHGDNRLGGSSLLECVVFGRIAGAEAAKAAVAQE
ncbi:hypothetical protein SLS62_002316 [Diatrype stigma]|uniref:FAD-dependent oxidoreductase 2 FAD-binding domain-containing protein n=1 Tax=Diatrype stigma TaxID=117547 RepID=A0AAN9YVU1_9PEZI